MSQVRVPYSVTYSALGGYSNVRLTVSINFSLISGYPNTRVSEVVAQPVVDGYPKVRSDFYVTQPVLDGYPKVRHPFILIQSLFPSPPERPMSNVPFPGFGNSVSNPAIPAGKDPFNTPLPGLTYSVHKKPQFKTKVAESAAGNEVRLSLMEYPRWDFEFTYEFLEDRSGAESSLKTIMGFFLSRRGSYDTFLVKDPDDYEVTLGECGTSDGLTLEFPLCRTLGGFVEKVGQLDTANSLTVYVRRPYDSTIPNTGPFTITVPDSAYFFEDNGVVKGGVAMTKVVGAPAAGQYSVAAGVYTFNGADNNDPVTISYTYTVSSSDYDVVMPNLIEFHSAPPVGTVLASFQFFFACRFTDDQQDFEKFADQLWSLQSCNFRSVIQ